jgi:hypothetical protein
MRKARIENGKVAEILDLSPFPPFAPELEWVECDVVVTVGDSFDGAAFLPPSPEELAAIAAQQAQAIADQLATDSAKADSTIRYFVSHTPAECYAKVQTDVVDLASAKVMLGRLAMAVSVLARNELR